MARAPFISLDGLDGTGKSTQCRLLADWLREQGYEVVLPIDPGGTAIGDQLRGLVLDRRSEMSMACEALLFMASRAQLTSAVLRPALDAGRAIVCDRFLLATVVYQGHAGGLDPEQLWKVGQFATGGLLPDRTIVLDLTPEIAQKRRRGPADRVESRDLAYHWRVREGFLAEARRQPERIRVVDADAPIAVVQEAIRREVEPLLQA
jgi:dTMP kinase